MKSRPNAPGGRRITRAAAIALAAALSATLAPVSASADNATIARVTITPSSRVASLIAQMTQAEKLSFVVNNVDPADITSAGYIPGVERLGIPPLRLVDGTAGIRTGTGITEKATAMPVPTMLGSTFDPDLAYAYGQAVGEEGRALQEDVLLAPMINIIRVPQSGRNFETFSEDPLVTAAIAAKEISGVQDAGMIATAKHYALNNQEANKTAVSANVSEQAFHEVYLPGYAAAVAAGTGAVMSAYNKVNGTFSASNSILLNDILKNELGFQGWVMSDWGTAHDPTDMNAGLDQAMFWPDSQANRGYFLPSFMEPVLADGTVPVTALNDAVARILSQMEKFGLLDGAAANRPPAAAASTKAQGVAQNVAEAGAVLLKNDGILPLSAGDDTIAVFGLTAAEPKVGGSGSASMEAGVAKSPVETITERAGASATVTYNSGSPAGQPIPAGAVTAGFPFDATGEIIPPGAFIPPYTGKLTISEPGSYTFNSSVMGIINMTIDGQTVIQAMGADSASGTISLTAGEHDIMLMVTGQGRLTWITPSGVETAFADATAAASAAEVAIVFAYDQTAVMADRTSLTLPSGQDGLIEAVANANPNTIVVLNTSSALTMPWLGKVKAVLDMYYPGQRGAEATARLLYGDVNPSGKLTQTFPVSEAKSLIGGNPSVYPGVESEEDYAEGLDIGYRWYAKNKVATLFPFGYGLSYTTFELSDATVAQEGAVVKATVKVANTGSRSGSEVVQVYADPTNDSSAVQAATKLVGFAKVDIAAGESKVVEIPIDSHQFEYWDADTDKWEFAEGTRRLSIGTSAAASDAAARLSVTVVAPEKIEAVKAELAQQVEAGLLLSPTGYDQASWAEFSAALALGQQLLADSAAAFTQLQDAQTALAAAQEALKADVSSLQLVVELAAELKQAEYSGSSWTPFSSALSAANAVLADANPSVAAVTEAAANLVDAMSGLQAVKTSALKSVLNSLRDAGLVPSDVPGETASELGGVYTTNSWQAYLSVLANAQAVAANSDSTQAEVDAAINEIVGAVSGLVRADTCPVKIKLNQSQLTLVKKKTLTLGAGVYYASGTAVYSNA
ncbi:MAG: glycoside hydrolase family 3 C-terminal domain-containing protein, partial [Propionibacteriaceae bacterium]|nr:glycoside hydrolase family 3 C-terminal domain-containing protein [Propionibacteriaceae bacterium]